MTKKKRDLEGLKVSPAVAPDGVAESPQEQVGGELSVTTEGASHPIAQVLDSYLASLRNISQTIQIVLPHLSKWLIKELDRLDKKLKSLAGVDDTELEAKMDSVRDFVEIESTLKQLDELQSNKALSVLAKSMYSQMFCEFDAFMGALLKLIYLRNAGLLKSVAREISLADLLDYPTIDAAKKALLDKEVETFRRGSYVEQFAQLESKFNITLRKFPEWGEFVELSQRRNIFTHNDGVVSDQYLLVCDREGYKFAIRPKTGDQLDANIQYFSRALVILSKVGFMLAHTLWSKLFPAELEGFHVTMNDTIFSYLEDKRWRTAGAFSEFAMTDPMRRNIAEIDLRIRIINHAIALKFSGKEAEASQVLKMFDWTASYRDFKLAILILEDKFEEAIVLMEAIGKSGEILEQQAYHTWPLFHKFRERPDFYATYEKIYGEPYVASMSADGKQPTASFDSNMPRGALAAEFVDKTASSPKVAAEVKSTRKAKSGDSSR